MADPLPATLPELLAPAGSMEALRAAVACGADAVYLGGKRFSARQHAGNFDDRELAEAVEFAHGRGVRVHVAVNTLLHDREIAGAAEYLVFLAATGVDAVLVQDPGLAALAREVVPTLPLHASTQMTIHNRAGLEWAASLGFSRAVLARELPLGEVEALGEAARDLGIGLEIFVHGALCYSYSGQCLLSSAIGGRSGNRGRCAQPCRKPYTLVRGEPDEYGRPGRTAPVPLADRYLLSTKDLSLYPHLDRVARAPVAALKIEGRMRSPEYVGTVTGIYRRALDAIAAGFRVPQRPGSEGAGAVPGGVGPLGTEPGSSREEEARSGSSCPGGQGPLWTGERGPSGAGDWAPSAADEEALALTFSRGFTGGCLCEGPGRIMGRDAPGHRGVLAGMVESVDEKTAHVAIRLSGSAIPEKGDGIVFRLRRGEGGEGETGMVLRRDPAIDAGVLWLKAERGTLPGIEEGARVFITRRARQREVPCFLPGTSAPRWPRVQLDLVLRFTGEGRPVLEGSVTRNGVQVMVARREAGFTAEPARERGLTAREVEEILSKRGDAPYAIRSARAEWPTGTYARRGDIGGLRRDLLAEVERCLSAGGKPGAGEESRARERLGRSLGAGHFTRDLPGAVIPPALVILASTRGEVTGIVEEGAGWIALEPAPPAGDTDPWRETGGMLREAAATAGGSGWNLLWKWPRITTDPWIRRVPEIAAGGAVAGVSGLMVEGTGAAGAARALLPGLPVHGGPGLNAWNARTVRTLSPLLASLTLSPELSLRDLGELVPGLGYPGGPPALGFPVEGNLELMTSEDRLTGLLPGIRGGNRGRQFIGLADATSRIFPVAADICGRTVIRNSVETCLIDHLPALRSLGISRFLIDARGRGPRYAGEMAALYREGLSVIADGDMGAGRRLGELREECRKRAMGGITRGAFLRGLREEEGEG